MYIAKTGNHSFNIETDERQLKLDGASVNFDCIPLGSNQFHILFNNQSLHAELLNVNRNTKILDFNINHKKISVQIEDSFDQLLVKMGIDKSAKQKISELKAPMPGLVLSLAVKEGETVAEGESLVVLEAMKMENVLNAPAEVVVKEILVKPGDKVEKNQSLIIFE